MVTRTDIKMVTGKINGQDVTVPAGTTILEATRMAGIEVPNLCYQPLLRPWQLVPHTRVLEHGEIRDVATLEHVAHGIVTSTQRHDRIIRADGVPNPEAQ